MSTLANFICISPVGLLYTLTIVTRDGAVNNYLRLTGRNGCATMSRVTGSGCMLTALMGAFCGAMPGQPFAAACAAAATMGVAGELAEARRLAHGTGNATFRTDLIDAVFNLTPAQLDASVRWESYSK